MTTILGIDPGSRITGYGVIKVQDKGIEYIASGAIRVGNADFLTRLQLIYRDIREVVDTFRPDEISIEQVFMHANPGAALKLGQARGAAIAGVSEAMLPVAEYSARQVKQAVVGYGAATKDQVGQMIMHLLNINDLPQSDAADALAIAVCHAHSKQTAVSIGAAQYKVRQGRWR